MKYVFRFPYWTELKKKNRELKVKWPSDLLLFVKKLANIKMKYGNDFQLNSSKYPTGDARKQTVARIQFCIEFLGAVFQQC